MSSRDYAEMMRERITDTLVFHPRNRRTGTPDSRRPACEAIAGIVLGALAVELQDLLDNEEPSSDHPGIRRVLDLLEKKR